MSCFLKSTHTRRRHAMNACRQGEDMDIALLPRKHGTLFQAALYLCSIAHTIDQPVL
jgi:hypothetical protein